jgi:ribosome assembly protein 1
MGDLSRYAVLSKRRGEVVEEDIIEGTELFIIRAHLPVVESIGFSSELLDRTSGAATAPQVLLRHKRTDRCSPLINKQSPI